MRRSAAPETVFDRRCNQAECAGEQETRNRKHEGDASRQARLFAALIERGLRSAAFMSAATSLMRSIR